MPRPGFYNDNEYRAYPFVFNPASQTLPTSAVVDAGIVMRLDSGFVDNVHTVWLASISRVSGVFTFTLQTSACGGTLVFQRPDSATDWAAEHTESNSGDPAWEGFLVTGPLTALAAELASGATRTFTQNEWQIEPGRIQNLSKSYLRAVNIGNYQRPYVPDCDSQLSGSIVTPDIVVNSQNISGPIKFTEGYNCRISQTDWLNQISVSAEVGGGTPADAGLCSNGSELALFPDEPLFAGSKFFSGGPACDELIFTINGLGGPTVTVASGSGVSIATQVGPPTVTVTRNLNALGNCAQPQS